MEAKGTRGFREGLRRELPGWVAEGLVDSATAARLTERYGLAEDGRPLAVTAVYVLGALLVGGGVLSFVAWNWDAMPDALRLLVLGGALVAAHGLGWRWWRATQSRPRLGHAFVFLGTLIFGADIGLVAQIFHVSSNWYGGFGAWAAGAAVAAALLESAPTAALAIVLAFVWALGWGEASPGAALALPWALAAGGVALAWRHRSRVLLTPVFALPAALAVVVVLQHGDWDALAAAVLGAGAGLLAVALLFAPGSEGDRLASPARWLGLAAFAATAALLSFHEVAEEVEWRGISTATSERLLTLAPAVLAAVLLAARRVAAGERLWRTRPELAAAVPGTALLLAAPLVAGDGVPTAIAANLALAALAVLLLLSALRELERGRFWAGTFLAGFLVVSRFFEFRAELWLKALAFAAAGTAVILAGLAFEKRLKGAPAPAGGGHAA